MRITGGIYKGRQVACPKGVIRPAMDRMRESLFSILGSLEGLSFLDLFSGSGIMGLEAASRGAHSIDLVEKDFIKKPTILKNITIAEVPIRLHMTTVQGYLKKNHGPWDVIYADPPFPMGGKLEILELIDQGKLLKIQGSLLMHYPGQESFPDKLGSLRKYDFRTYGNSHLVFYTRDDESSEEA